MAECAPAAADKVITVGEILRRIAEVRERMSARSDARAVLDQCEVTIRYLAARMPDPDRTPSGLVLPPGIVAP